MERLSGNEIRRRWIAFFEKRGHLFVPGVNLIPQGDKSLLWVNAGVTGLKKYFDGSLVPPSRRIVNVQKSIRTNDIENVGRTARHHTFFEMLGNFSIGDYFRREVIAWAMEILTDPVEGFGMEKERLYATYNPSDLESRRLWIENGLEESHLIPLEGNFWEIGEGPCGPNTEVFYDRGEEYDPSGLGLRLLQEEIENDRYIEIWGIVFSQFEAVAGVKREDYKELPSKNIDTGAGLERIACILQKTPTNFETDLFMPIVKAAEKLTGVGYGGDALMSYRVIADHARCLAFALSDGALFGNDGRGYVLRRILRRAMRYGQKLGLHGPFLHKLIPAVVEIYDGFYPELDKNLEKVVSLVKSEEERFVNTLESGERMLDGLLREGKDIDGESAFRLHDTYGFPLELTVEIAAEKGLKVDVDGFRELMEEQRERARTARGNVESFHHQSKDLLAFKEHGEFLYETTSVKSRCLALFVDGRRVKQLSGKGEAAFEKTPFYVEMGGQVSDTGEIEAEGMRAIVTGMGKAPNLTPLHEVEVKEGKLFEGGEYLLKVDTRRRSLIERNHSATHLLHAALSAVLGHVEQRGSYVDGDYLRFDYSFNRKPTNEELSAVEDLVNEKIAEGLIRKTEILPIEEARKTGAEMEFEGKYGSEVRVVSFEGFSKEFCGGTHVKNTASIGSFRLESDESVSSGVRRITAYTSLGALSREKEERQLIASLSNRLSSDPSHLESRVEKLVNDLGKAEKELRVCQDELSRLAAASSLAEGKEIDGIYFLLARYQGADRNKLLSVADSIKNKKKDCLLVLIGGDAPSYPSVVISQGKAPKANETMKKLSLYLGGGGGGRETMASGSFKNLDRLEEVRGELEGLL